MRSIEDKGCYSHGPVQENMSSSSGLSFEFQKGNNGANRKHHHHHHHHRTALGKSTPSKWDDAQKWLVGLSKVGEKNQSSNKPRNSNADDLRLIAPVPQKEQENSSSEDEEEEGEQEEENGCSSSVKMAQYDVETKKVDGNYESIWRINKPNSTTVVRSVCVRDMGTDMTPIASQEPSRTATPLRATTPVARSPISSGSSTPVRCQHRMPPTIEGQQTCPLSSDGRGEANPSGRGNGSTRRYVEESNNCKNKPDQNQNSDQDGKLNPLETRAVAWDEAESAKYMAR